MWGSVALTAVAVFSEHGSFLFGEHFDRFPEALAYADMHAIERHRRVLVVPPAGADGDSATVLYTVEYPAHLYDGAAFRIIPCG